MDIGRFSQSVKQCASLVALALVLTSVASAQRPGPRGNPGNRPANGGFANGQFDSELMRKVMEAPKKLRYSGTRAVEIRANGERIRHIETIIHDGMMTRTEFSGNSALDGQVIVENGRRRMKYLPRENEIWTLPGRPDEALQSMRRFMNEVRRNNFKVERGSGGSIAGHDTLRLGFKDNHGNLVQRIWIEPRTGMVLKRELFDLVGTLIGSFEFSSINFSPKFSPADFQINRRGAKQVTPIQRLEEIEKRSGIRTMTLPPSSGFELESVQLMKFNQKDIVMLQFIGETGRVSIFQFKGEVDIARMRKMAGGRVTTHMFDRGDVHICLLGSVPEQELRRLAQLLVD